MTLCEAEDLCEYEEWNRPCKVMTKRLAKSDKEKSPCMKLAQKGSEMVTASSARSRKAGSKDDRHEFHVAKCKEK